MRRAALATTLLAALLGTAGCASKDSAHSRTTAARTTRTAPTRAPDPLAHLHAHPRAVDPVAGGAPQAPETAEQELANQSSAHLPHPQSDAEIRRELAASGLSAGNRAAITQGGLAVAPLDAPPTVQDVILAANTIARSPYRYGGGHMTWEDNAYDCSGSISFAFANAGLVSSPLDSTSFEHWGQPGPGQWITIYANAGHAWMTVAGLRFDTGGLPTTGSRWQAESRSTSGFVARHPPGL